MLGRWALGEDGGACEKEWAERAQHQARGANAPFTVLCGGEEGKPGVGLQKGSTAYSYSRPKRRFDL